MAARIFNRFGAGGFLHAGNRTQRLLIRRDTMFRRAKRSDLRFKELCLGPDSPVQKHRDLPERILCPESRLCALAQKTETRRDNTFGSGSGASKTGHRETGPEGHRDSNEQPP